MHLSSRTVAYDTRDLPKRTPGRVCYLLLSRASNVLEFVARRATKFFFARFYFYLLLLLFNWVRNLIK